MNFSTAVWAPGSVMTVRFKEVAVYFSEEEWSQLDPWQKELYGNVMRDIHAALLSLGYTILHPDVLCRIRRHREPYVSSQKDDRKGISFPSTGASDILFNIKCDEELRADDGNPTENGPQYLSGASGLSPDIIFRIKHDEKDREDASLKSDLATHLVFNPKLSIWIKEVDEVSEVPPKVLKATWKDRNVTEIKTEEAFTPDWKKSPPPQDITKTKNNAPKSHQAPDENPMLHDDSQASKGEESLLSIVLRRANSGGLRAPNYKQSDICKDVNCSQNVPGIVDKETFYPPKPPFLQTPSNNDLLRIRHVPPGPPPHEIERPFRCRLCGKCFKTPAMLNVHMKTHSGTRPYQCNECGKSFRDNWNLKVHQKIHTGETPYRCSICDKGFVQYATYMKHQRIHTGEKPYSCCYCDKSFTNSSNLVRHYRTHTGEKPYACAECGKGFSHSTSLIQHKRLHKVVPTENGTNGPRNTTNQKRD
ncbi:zinc finger protein 568-like isoform X11 [Ranitomeya variabilis]